MTEDSREGRACYLVYEPVRDAVLADFPWNSCMKRARLSLLAAAPTWGYDHKYQLPADCLRVWQVSADADTDETESVEFVIEGRELLTDEDTVYILYSSRETDVSKYTDGLCQTIIAGLVLELASTLVRLSLDVRNQFLAEYESVKNKAQSVDAFEITTYQRGTHDFINVRY